MVLYERPKVKIGRNTWIIVRDSETTASPVYKLRDVIASGGEEPNFASSY